MLYIDVPSLTSDLLLGYMTYVKLLGQGMVIVNKRETAVELLEKRSELYADRYVPSRMRCCCLLLGWFVI